MRAFEPTPEQLQAVEAFKARYGPQMCRKRGFAHWTDALFTAWHQGWDYEMEGGSHLREMRNTPGAHDWVRAQRSIKAARQNYP